MDSKEKVYLVTQETENGHQHAGNLGIFSSREKAESYMAYRESITEGLVFYIKEYTIDIPHDFLWPSHLRELREETKNG